ncbi:hypothetical protein QAD02_011033 [Eretmocerus hayati]|uniref:Uncharacterized protein n=1 Tax=Eretmocerus hayati TaxID=131215 RepID=A0ACC2NVT5_9HYME|nr:hypothetical protein QAD02_011033 [Eretmocerus hayati]
MVNPAATKAMINPTTADGDKNDLGQLRGNLDSETVQRALGKVKAAPASLTEDDARKERLAADELASRGIQGKLLTPTEMQMQPLDLTKGCESTSGANASGWAVETATIATTTNPGRSAVIPVYTSGRIKKLDGMNHPIPPTMNLLPVINALPPSAARDPMQPCMGSLAVGITVGLLSNEPLYAPQD